jgi:hypothetical protein
MGNLSIRALLYRVMSKANTEVEQAVHGITLVEKTFEEKEKTNRTMPVR